jgi:hypothetical protein
MGSLDQQACQKCRSSGMCAEARGLCFAVSARKNYRQELVKIAQQIKYQESKLLVMLKGQTGIGAAFGKFLVQTLRPHEKFGEDTWRVPLLFGVSVIASTRRPSDCLLKR